MSNGKADKKTIAVSGASLAKWGCPDCGYRSGSMPFSGGGAGLWRCGECGGTCVVLAEGVLVSPITLGDDYRPELQPHPREGIPARGKEDLRPESGGEFFRSRGIGTDNVKCFVCGSHGMHSNIAAFVQTKAAGERCLEMFSLPGRVAIPEGVDHQHYMLAHADKAMGTALGALHDSFDIIGGVRIYASIDRTDGTAKVAQLSYAVIVWTDFRDNNSMITAPSFVEMASKLQANAVPGVPVAINNLSKADKSINEAMDMLCDVYDIVGSVSRDATPFIEDKNALYQSSFESLMKAVNTDHVMAYLDYREYEPDRVQVKIGGCKDHLHNLEELDRLVSDGTITSHKVAQARKRQE